MNATGEAEGGIDAAAFIAGLPVQPVPGLRGIRLHRAMPESGVARLTQPNGAPPYWAYLWAGGLALAHYLQERPDAIAGKRVLDLGAGSGLVGIAAALAGAFVLAADRDPIARAAIPINAALNDIAVAVIDLNLAAGTVPDVDLILAGDVFYEAKLARRMTRFLDRAAAAGIDALIGDPCRATLPVDRLQELACYDVTETGSRTMESKVYRFVPPLSPTQDILVPPARPII